MRGKICKIALSSSNSMKGQRVSLKGTSKEKRLRHTKKDKEIGRDKIAAQENDRAVEFARIAADKAKIAADMDLQRDKIAANERLEMKQIESITEQAEKDRELKLTKKAIRNRNY